MLTPTDLLGKILSSGCVESKDGNRKERHSSISEEQGKAVQLLAKEAKASSILELGLAYGISTLFLAPIAKAADQGSYIVCDPEQDWWEQIGLLNLERCGLRSFVDFRPQGARQTILDLVSESAKIDFVFLDYIKVFDMILVDFALLDSILKPGAILVFDDCTYPGIRKRCRLIAQLPHYEICFSFGKDKLSTKRRLMSSLIEAVTFAPRLTNDKFPRRQPSDSFLGVDYFCLGFRKIGNDSRNWDWHVSF